MMHVVFRLSGNVYAAPIEPVEEVLPFLPIEETPGAPDFLKGVVFVRGHLIPVLDAAERLRLRRSQPAPADPHLIAFRVEDRLIALLVDEAIDLVDLPGNPRIGSAELFVSEGPFGGMVECGGEVYRLIDPARLMKPAESAAVDQAREKMACRDIP